MALVRIENDKARIIFAGDTKGFTCKLINGSVDEYISAYILADTLGEAKEKALTLEDDDFELVHKSLGSSDNTYHEFVEYNTTEELLEMDQDDWEGNAASLFNEDGVAAFEAESLR